jgi:hypothetical protein
VLLRHGSPWPICHTNANIWLCGGSRSAHHGKEPMSTASLARAVAPFLSVANSWRLPQYAVRVNCLWAPAPVSRKVSFQHSHSRWSSGYELWHKPERHGFETPWDQWFFSLGMILPDALGPGAYSASNRKEYQKQKNYVAGEQSASVSQTCPFTTNFTLHFKYKL